MKKIAKTVMTIGLLFLPFLTMATAIFAEGGVVNLAPQGQFTRLAGVSIGGVVRALITLALVLAALVAFGFLIYGGILWITSGGDKTKTETARNTITAALVGLLIVFGAWALIQIIQVFFGISILQLNIEPIDVVDTT